MCAIHSAAVSSCELSVCILCAVVSCLSAAVSCLCAAVSCSHHTHRFAVSTVVVVSRHCLHSYPRLLSPQNAFYTYTRGRVISLCVSTLCPCVSPSYPVCHTERERARPARCFGKHWKCGERETEGVCSALSVLEVYTYIYIYIYI